MGRSELWWHFRFVPRIGSCLKYIMKISMAMMANFRPSVRLSLCPSGSTLTECCQAVWHADRRSEGGIGNWQLATDTRNSPSVGPSSRLPAACTLRVSFSPVSVPPLWAFMINGDKFVNVKIRLLQTALWRRRWRWRWQRQCVEVTALEP